MISLKNIRDRLVTAEAYLKTADAANYIANSGTCSSTNNLAGRPVGSFTCGGSCSWTCSGGCSKGAGYR
jgi:phage tail sheath gpL-like